MIKKIFTLFSFTLFVFCPLCALEPPLVVSSDKCSKNEITEHSLKIGANTFPYEAIAGTMAVKNEKGGDKAHIFYTAYFLKDPLKKDRPITFCFNGGPGSASVWLHIGAFGPKKVVIDDVKYNASPGQYEDNPHTLLPTTDLVFVDPVSTGFSKPATGIEAKEFYSVEEDINTNAEFIREFLTQYQRWGSEKFLLGESYGTLRVTGLAHRLHEHYFLDVNGLILISSVIDFQTVDNDLGYIVSLPSLAACAWYHKKCAPMYQSQKLNEFLQEVQNFATHDYATALLLGNTLDPKQKSHIAETLSGYLGVPLPFIYNASLRIKPEIFAKELLKSEELLIGRFDGRMTGFDIQRERPWAMYDPSLDSVAGSFQSAFQQYLIDVLHVKDRAPYWVLNHAVQPWDFGQKGQTAGLGYVNMTGELVSTLSKNPQLRVFIASGYFDIVTPYFATDYTVEHLDMNPALFHNIERQYFDAGHLMYLHPPSLARLQESLGNFIASS